MIIVHFAYRAYYRWQADYPAASALDWMHYCISSGLRESPLCACVSRHRIGRRCLPSAVKMVLPSKTKDREPPELPGPRWENCFPHADHERQPWVRPTSLRRSLIRFILTSQKFPQVPVDFSSRTSKSWRRVCVCVCV